MFLPINDSHFSVYGFPSIDTNMIKVKVQVDRYSENPTYAHYSGIHESGNGIIMTVIDDIGQFIGSLQMALSGGIVAIVYCGGERICYSDDFTEIGFNGDCGCNFPERVPLSSEDAFDNISISPNPVYDILEIEGIDKMTIFTISNSIGQTVKKGKLSHEIDLSMLSQGVYFITLISEQKYTTTKLFTK